jgi:hypothetical protein
MTKMKCVKSIEEFNITVNQHSKKLIQAIKAESSQQVNTKLKEVLDKIGKDYDIPVVDLYEKYLPLKISAKSAKELLAEPSEELPIEEPHIDEVYEIYLHKGNEYFMLDSILYNKDEKKVGQIKNSKVVLIK